MRLAACRLSPSLVAATLVAGCSGGDGSSSSTERLSHAWQYQSGTFFDVYAYDGGQANWLVLSDDGTGELFSRRPVSGATGCAPLLYSALDNDVLQIEIPVLRFSDFAFAGKGSGAESWLLAWEISGGELTLTDPEGAFAVFERADVDDMLETDRCETPLAFDEVPLPIEPADTDPVFGSDGVNLWYATDGDFFGVEQTGFNPATGATAGTLTIDLPDLFFWQGTDVWAGFNSGHNQSLLRLTPPSYSEYSPADEVDTLYDLQNEVSMGNAIVDSAGMLWMAGQELSENRNHIVVIDTAPEPDLVVSDVTIDTSLRAIAQRDGELWALQWTLGPMLVRLDPATGAVLQNVKLPEEGYWDYLASVGGELYVHSYDYDNDQHHFMRVSPL